MNFHSSTKLLLSSKFYLKQSHPIIGWLCLLRLKIKVKKFGGSSTPVKITIQKSGITVNEGADTKYLRKKKV
jgi:hypothetical protein